MHFLKEAPRFAAPKLEGDPKIESHEIKVAASTAWATLTRSQQQIGGQFVIILCMYALGVIQKLHRPNLVLF